MPELDLTPIKGRLEHITNGPWVVTQEEGRSRWVDARPDLGKEPYSVTGMYGTVVEQTEEDGLEVIWRQSDADFIAHARTDIPALIAEVERLRADIAFRDKADAEAVKTFEATLVDLEEEERQYELDMSDLAQYRKRD